MGHTNRRFFALPGSNDADTQACAFGILLILLSPGVKFPQKANFGDGNRRYQAKRVKNSNFHIFQKYCINCNQILQSDKDHQVLLGGPNVSQTNPKRWTAAILKN